MCVLNPHILTCEHHIQKQIINKIIYAINLCIMLDFIMCAFCDNIKRNILISKFGKLTLICKNIV
jgi:hypothetical protein